MNTAQEHVLAPLKRETITIPEWYRHETQLADFQRRKPGVSIHESLVDESHRHVAHALTRGMTYEISIISINTLESVQNEECLQYLEERGAKLVGAQGLSLVCELAPGLFKANLAVLSFTDRDIRQDMPKMTVGWDGEWTFMTCAHDTAREVGECFLCVE